MSLILVRVYGHAAIAVFPLPVAAWQRASCPYSWACTIWTWKSHGSLPPSIFCIASHSWEICPEVSLSCVGAVAFWLVAPVFLSCFECEGIGGNAQERREESRIKKSQKAENFTSNTWDQKVHDTKKGYLHCLNTMKQCLHLGTEEHDDPLPPSSPPIVQPSSSLTMLDESQGHPTTIYTSSPLSSPPESLALGSLILPTTFQTWRLVPNDGGNEDSFVPSSPIRNCDDTRCKAQKWWDEEQDAHTRQLWEEEQQRHTIVFKECLSILSTNKLTFTELTEYMLFCEDETTKAQYDNFLVNRDLITRMLSLFTLSKVNKLCQKAVKDWARSTVQQAINKEVNAATQSGDLQITDHEINSSFASSLSFKELKAMVQQHCPSFLGLLMNVITTDQQVGSTSKDRLAAKEHVR